MHMRCFVCVLYLSVCVEYLLTAARNASIGDAEERRRYLPVQEVRGEVPRGDAFQCMRCIGEKTHGQTQPIKIEGLSNRQRCEVVDDGLCHPRDVPNAEGCVDLAVTTRTRSGWKKLREPMLL